MFDKVLLQAAVKAVSAHPPLAPQRCVNARQNKARCDACLRACPAGVFINPEKGRADWDKCIDCGLCAALCPSGALGLSGGRVKKVAELLASDRDHYALGCGQVAAALDYKAWCLACVKWEILCALALKGRVELVRGDCEHCPHREALSCFHAVMERARAFLGPARFDARVSEKTDAQATPPAMTRREAFGSVFAGFRRTVGSALPEDWKLGEDGLFPRLMLVRQLDRLPPEETGTFGWIGPVFTDACRACGICEKVCVNGAISLIERNGAWHVVHQPCLCAGCGACMAVCPEKAISAIGEYRLAAGERCMARRLHTGTCPTCGSPVRPEEDGQPCPRCRAKRPRK